MGKCARNGAREVVKGKFDQLEVLELAQKSGYWAGDIGISDKERLEFGEFGDGGLDWAHEVGELVEGDGLQVREVAHRRRNLSRRIGVWNG